MKNYIKEFIFLTLLLFVGACEKGVETPPNPPDIPLEEYNYQLPVVFHVLYKNPSDPNQNVSQERLNEILKGANNLFQNTENGAEMNLEFVLATHDPYGNLLQEPGIERRIFSGEYPIDASLFINDKNNVPLLWDPNNYINIMVYNFVEDEESGQIILGISHLPYSAKGENYLEGLGEVQYSNIELSNLNYPHSLSINSLFAGVEYYNTNYDVINTLAHELCHYLGVFHVFSEDDIGVLNECKDTDYCEDTPSYNKVAYDIFVDYYFATHTEETASFRELAVRNSCSQEQFISTNIMDYSFGYSDQFTADQSKRVRHVLNYSPLIPGPKKTNTKIFNAPEGVVDLPVRVIR